MGDVPLQVIDFLFEDISLDLAKKAIYPAIEKLNQGYCKAIASPLQQKHDIIVKHTVLDPEHGGPIYFARFLSCLHTLGYQDEDHIHMIEKFRMFKKHVSWVHYYRVIVDRDDPGIIRHKVGSIYHGSFSKSYPYTAYPETYRNILYAPTRHSLRLFQKLNCCANIVIGFNNHTFNLNLLLYCKENFHDDGENKR